MINMILLNRKTKAKIKEQSFKEAPFECCGFIVKNEKNKPIVFPCTNVSNKKEDNFRISPEDYLRASELGDIEAVYHSHPKESHSDNFTPLDLLNQDHGFEIILYLLHKNKFLISSCNNYLNKYLERDYKINVTDCFTLMVDFYEQELGINIKRYNYKIHDFFGEENWQNKEQSPFDTLFEKEGFSKVKYENIKMYDLIFFNDPKIYHANFSNHMAIYVGNQTMMHQPFNRVSELCSFTSSHLKFVTKIVRHKKFL